MYWRCRWEVSHMNQTWGGAPGALLPYLCNPASIRESRLKTCPTPEDQTKVFHIKPSCHLHRLFTLFRYNIGQYFGWFRNWFTLSRFDDSPGVASRTPQGCNPGVAELVPRLVGAKQVSLLRKPTNRQRINESRRFHSFIRFPFVDRVRTLTHSLLEDLRDDQA